MFQYALGTALAQRNHVPLQLDITSYPDGFGRIYSLDSFAIHAIIMRIAQHTTIVEKSFPFDPSILNVRTDSCLDGYWQSEKYFAEIAPLIHEHFSFRQPPKQTELAKKIQNEESVSVSVRRTDYAHNKDVQKIHGLVSLPWYRMAYDQIRQSVQNPRFYIFTDEPDWVGLADLEGTLVDGNDIEQLQLLSFCRHSILANSSFSWWGSWLSTRGGIHIAPDRWFVSKDIDTRDVIPERWIKICKDPAVYRVLVAIPAYDKSREEQQALRETWAKERPGMDVRFFFGSDDVLASEPDEIVLASPNDYPDNSFKIYELIKWAFDHGYDFVFKCDTDTFIVPDRLLLSDYDAHDYVGFEIGNEPRSGGVGFASGGAGYWLSRAAMRAILSHSMMDFSAFEGKIQPEDTSVCRVLAQHGIYIHADTRYSWNYSLGYPARENDFITTHFVDPQKMRELYASLQ